MSPQMKSLQLWQKVGLVRVTFLKQCPGAELWYLGRSPGDCCALFFTASGLAVRLSAASASAGLGRPESAMSSNRSSPTNPHQRAVHTGYSETNFHDRKNPGFLADIPTGMERHPTGPDTAGLPGEGVLCSASILEFPSPSET